MEKDEIKGSCQQVDVTANKLKITGNWSPEQISNIRDIEQSMSDYGIINKFARIAMLAIVAKESAFIPQAEISYSTTPNSRIRVIFGSRVARFTDIELSQLKLNDDAFFDTVYGGMYGNAPDMGYEYRGAGYNQNTFHDNYLMLTKRTGIDFVNHPELMQQSKPAAIAYMEYMKDRFKTIPSGLRQMNDFQSLDEAILTVFRANAGWGKRIEGATKDSLNRAIYYSKCFTY
jgi:predicted chitinase